MYVVFMVTLVYPITPLVLLASALTGSGGSFLWIAQGMFLTKASPPDKRGLYAGVFWGINYCSMIFGNLFAYIVFSW